MYVLIIILIGDLSPRRTGIEKKCSPQAFVGISAGNFFRSGDGDGEAFSNREFPIDIPMYQDDICLCIVLTNV
jgi:hypothetical protein